MVESGVLMPKEPKIMQMDWKSLGYEKVYVDGRIRWIPQEHHQEKKNKRML